MVSERQGGETRVRGMWEVGPRLLELVAEHDLPVL